MSREKKSDKKISRTIQLTDEKYQHIKDDADSQQISFSQKIEQQIDFYYDFHLTEESLRLELIDLDKRKQLLEERLKTFVIDYRNPEDIEMRHKIKNFLEFIINNSKGKYRSAHWHDVGFKKILGTYLQEKIINTQVPIEKAWRMAQTAWDAIWYAVENNPEYKDELMNKKYAYGIDLASGANYRAYIDTRIKKKIHNNKKMYEDKKPAYSYDDNKIISSIYDAAADLVEIRQEKINNKVK